jgi:hypothetical protein
MKRKSKLDSYHELIVANLSSRNISQILGELKKAGCKTLSHSNLCSWIDKLPEADGIKIPKRERGRPPNPKPILFGFLPEPREHGREIEIPLFFVCMQTLPPSFLNLPRHYRMLRNITLTALGLPEGIDTAIRQWPDVERFARLSDAELCLLAFLRSDLPPPPFTAESKEIAMWFNELVALASNLRSEICKECRARIA